MPNLHKSSLTAEEKEFYYKAMLVLFKPHDYSQKALKEPQESYEVAYYHFLATKCAASVDAQIQDQLFTNYYLNETGDDIVVGESEEDQVLHDHPFAELENDPRKEGTTACRRHENHYAGEEAAILEAMVESEVCDADVDAYLNIAPIRAELPEEIRSIFEVTRLLHPGYKLEEHTGILPVFTGMKAFKESLVNASLDKPENVNGVDMFRRWEESTTVKIKLLYEVFEPIPWTEPSRKHASVAEANAYKNEQIKKLCKFDSIQNISKAMELNFWQHAVFETYARHLKYKFLLDIKENVEEMKTMKLPAGHQTEFLKTQLIGYVGGIAGSGKSSVIAAILTFAQLWGRRDTVETMSFTGLASQQIDGHTIHKSRGLETFGYAPRMADDVTRKVRCIYLTIIDEISMVGQKLCGSAECLTRFIRNSQLPWGGIDLILAGDFFQLPPVKDVSITKQPTDKRGDSHYNWYLSAYNLFLSCNYIVFLTDNMRQKHDEQYRDILERMHWGVNTQADLDVLNTRSMVNGALDIETHYRRYEEPVDNYFTPMAISTNRERCGYNKETIYAICKKERCCVYEILAHSSRVANRAVIQRLKYSDDDFTGKLPFLLSFHTNGMPAMITKRIEQLESLNIISNGTLGFIIGYAHEDQTTACIAPNIEDDNSLFRISLTEDNIYVKRFKKAPAYLLFKVRGCSRRLVKQYPVGVVPLPLAAYKASFRLPGADAKSTMMISTFSVIPAYALTPEKLQGVTLDHELFISKLESRSPQILYVVHSRVRTLINLILTELLTMEYVRKFLPNEELVHLVSGLIDRIQVPSYMPQSERTKFEAWKAEQKGYAEAAIKLHLDKTLARLAMRPRKRQAIASGAKKLTSQAAESTAVTSSARANPPAAIRRGPDGGITRSSSAAGQAQGPKISIQGDSSAV